MVVLGMDYESERGTIAVAVVVADTRPFPALRAQLRCSAAAVHQSTSQHFGLVAALCCAADPRSRAAAHEGLR